MAQKVVGYIKLQIPAGKATSAPRRSGLGQHGVNIMAFTKEFNERTKNDAGMIIPGYHHGLRGPFVQLHHQDPAGAGPHQEGLRHRIRFGCTEQAPRSPSFPRRTARRSRSTKMPDLNAASLEAAMSMIAGTARSMGITVEE